jgi:putative spermidine/putrescine transport system substrate-binding protein
MKTTIKIGIAAAAVLAGGALAQARDLTVVSWGGAYQNAQKEAYFEPFRQKAKVPLIDESWDGGIGVLRTKVEGGNTTWDVVQVESEELAVGCDEGLFEKLDFSKIGGQDRYIKEAVHPCGVGAIVYDFVLAYDKGKLKEPPKGWADFFDTQKIPGKRALRGGPKSTLEIALMADGVEPAKVYEVLKTPAGVDRAFKKLDSIKKDLILWKAGAQPPQLLASGEVVLTSAYNGRIDAANRDDKRDFGIVWNQALFTIDSWVILKSSPNRDNAYKLIDFMGQAENQARLPLKIAYGVTHRDANKSIPAERLKDLPTAPENFKGAIEISTEFWLENIDRLNERFNKWAASQ